MLKVLLAAPAATFAWTEAEAAQAVGIGASRAHGGHGETVRAEVLHRDRIQAGARARRHHHSEGRAIGQRHRRRRARVHGLHDDRSAGAAGRDARRAGVARRRVPEALRQDVPQLRRGRTDRGARRHRVAGARASRSSRTASRSSATSAISPRAASGRRAWASTILQYMGNRSVARWNGCPPEALKKLGVSYE